MHKVKCRFVMAHKGHYLAMWRYFKFVSADFCSKKLQNNLMHSVAEQRIANEFIRLLILAFAFYFKGFIFGD